MESDLLLELLFVGGWEVRVSAMKWYRSGIAGFLVFGFVAGLSAQTHWPQFRGPGARGVATSDKLPIQWSPTENVAWKVELPGRGWSSPIVWGDLVFLTWAISDGEEEAPQKGLYFGGERGASMNRHRWQVVCLDKQTGKQLWMKELHSAVPDTSIHIKNSHASETPVTDGEHVYVLFGQIGIFCLGFDGNVVWSHPLKPGETRLGWGTSISPVLHEDKVFVVRDFENGSSLLAWNKHTGKLLWEIERDEPTNFATPHVWEHAARTELVVPGRNRVRSYSMDGQVLWSFKGMSTITIPTPFVDEGFLYLAAGYVGDRETPNKPVYALRPGAIGDITLPPETSQSEFIAWMEPNAAPYNPSPLVYQGRLYVLWDFGFLSARDARTGRELYDKQRLRAGDTAAFTASPWAGRDRVFCLSEDGDTYVVRAGDKYELERVNSLGEMCLATPAISGDRLFIRTTDALWCLREP